MRTVALAIAMLLIFPLAVMSADSSIQPKAAEKKVREKISRGEVKVVDPAARVLIVVGKDEVSFTADSEMLRDIRLNDQVTVKYTEKDGMKTVSSIIVDSKQKGKKRIDKRSANLGT
jgi:hypothetical protein